MWSLFPKKQGQQSQTFTVVANYMWICNWKKWLLNNSLLNNVLFMYRQFCKICFTLASIWTGLNINDRVIVCSFSKIVFICFMAKQGSFSSEILSIPQIQGGQLLWRSYYLLLVSPITSVIFLFGLSQVPTILNQSLNGFSRLGSWRSPWSHLQPALEIHKFESIISFSLKNLGVCSLDCKRRGRTD